LLASPRAGRQPPRTDRSGGAVRLAPRQRSLAVSDRDAWPGRFQPMDDRNWGVTCTRGDSEKKVRTRAWTGSASRCERRTSVWPVWCA